MKRTSIVLTKDNVKQVAGMLKKFFKCNHQRGEYVFENIHDFDTGWKPSNYNDFPFYFHIPEITVKPDGIVLNFGPGIGSCYTMGTRFRFYGSALKTQSSWNIGKYRYCYDLLTVVKSPSKDILEKADNDSEDREYDLFNDFDEYSDLFEDDEDIT